MLRLRHKLLIQAFRVFDQLILVGALVVLVAWLREGGSFAFLRGIPASVHSPINAFGAMLLFLTWAAIFSYFVQYDANRFTPVSTGIRQLLKATAACTFFLFVIGELFAISMLSNLVILCFWVATSLLGMVARLVLRAMLMKLRRSGMNCRHVVVVGTNKRAVDIVRRIEAHPELGYRIGGFIAHEASNQPSNGAESTLPGPVVGRLAEFKSFLERGAVDEVMVCLPLRDCYREICDVVTLCRELGVVVRVLPDLADGRVLHEFQIETFEGEFVITLFRERLLGQLLAKRVLDVMVSSIMLVLLSPLLLAVALLIKLTSPGPVFFAQERVGMNKRKFRLLKFRSMVVDAEARKRELAAQNEVDGPVFKIRNDPRVTPVGYWLRKTSIDELPQLINVLKGEMSLVGPRPPLPSEVDQYEWIYRRRLSIKPGITCLWQIGGRNNLPFARWMELDREYIENWSIWLDLKILFKTVPVVLLGRGAY
jgi:exopolysaccharide biosynthesis polyprenyl glycosylphosphotransferase